jgi:Poly(3-hydroxybutyrate) depolymerase
MKKQVCAFCAVIVLFVYPVSGIATELVNNVAAQQKSAGCGLPAPDAPPATVTVAGRKRDIIAVVPTDYRPDRPHDLVIAFHGRTNSNAEVRRYFDLERHATEPTIFVYPASLQDSRGLNTWADPGDKPESLRDFKLFDAVLEALSEAYCLDTGSVFVVGHSLGASFAISLACARGGAIRGLASVGGGLSRTPQCSGPVAAMVMHNPRDAQVPIAEGLRVRRSLLAQDDLPGDSAPDFPQRFNCRRYGPEKEGNPVLWCPLADDWTASGRFYPHQWPTGTGEAIMTFFGRLG